MKIYLSTKKKFDMSFLSAEFPANDPTTNKPPRQETVLLWNEPVGSGSLSKSFLISNLDCVSNGLEGCDERDCDASFRQAVDWLQQADEKLKMEMEAGVISTLSNAGQGIESTSILLTLYQKAFKAIGSLPSLLFGSEGPTNDDAEPTGILERSSIYLPPISPVWKSLTSNSTVHLHVVVVRRKNGELDSSQSSQEAAMALNQASRTNSLLLGQVDLLKYDSPDHLTRPGRILYHDIAYMVKRYILGDKSRMRPPWDMEYAKPEYFAAYEAAQRMKDAGAGYPYWKPEVAVKFLVDLEPYPIDFAHTSGMDLVRVSKTLHHPTGIAHIPALHVDEIGLTSEKYIPVNETITTLPLRVTFDRSDVASEANTVHTTATTGGISPARWRLLSHLSQSIESQKELGFEQSDIDDLRRLIADTDVMLLGITVLASALHLLFEFLTFKNEVSFWRNNEDLTGLSVRSLFLDLLGQIIIVLYLVEKESSLLMIVPSAIGCVIAMWKCHRAAGFAIVQVNKNDARAKEGAWWNVAFRLFGYELRATRLEVLAEDSSDPADGTKDSERKTKAQLHALTLECDRIASRRLGSVLLPLVLVYSVYSLMYEEHAGWYTWLITSASSAVYAFGFVLMTPQLFLNYKLKSVAHLPWRVLIYKSLNTFIDDLFSFIIRMPAMARISCFRDDVVFFIYLYQRWLYPVDKSRPVEGGDETEVVSETKKNQ